jgi:hypothetical protein
MTADTQSEYRTTQCAGPETPAVQLELFQGSVKPVSRASNNWLSPSIIFDYQGYGRKW